MVYLKGYVVVAYLSVFPNTVLEDRWLVYILFPMLHKGLLLK